MIERRRSKALSAANHVVWTENELMIAPFYQEGLVSDGQEFGFLRVQGREVLCAGLQVDFGSPAKTNDVRISIGIYRSDGILASPLLTLRGITSGDEIIFSPVIAMPSTSLWKLRLAVEQGDDENLPQGVTASYRLAYANAASNSTEWTANRPASGIGYWTVGGTFVVT